jgi:hypothetical protein
MEVASRYASVLMLTLLPMGSARAQESDVPVLATDAIALAGRTDIVIPPIGGDLSGFPLLRIPPGPGQVPETFPVALPVTTAGACLYFSAFGSARFSSGGADTGPDGDVSKDLPPVGGISGYQGPGGSLVGVFLDDEIPLADPPPALDFSDAALGTDFASLAPELRQIFFIGDGLTGTGGGIRQCFTTPTGGTRVFLGTLDVVYVDNTGSFFVDQVPEPSLGLLSLAAVATLMRLRPFGRPRVPAHPYSTC